MKPQLQNIHPHITKWWEKNTLPDTEATRQGFGKALTQIIQKNKRIIALSADLAASTGLKEIQQKHPEQFIDVGVAEQTLAGVAAGLASEGFVPVMTSFAVFSPGRNWDFIRAQIVLNKLPVVIVGSHAGLATGPDGATHQALEDVALMRSLPGMRIVSPCDSHEAQAAIKEAVKRKQPTYLRLVREKTPLILRNAKQVKTTTLIKGTNTTLISTGTTAWQCIQAAKLLWKQHRISATVIHMGTIKPFDNKTIEKITTPTVFTIEDHNIIGGLGSAAAETIAEQGLTLQLTRICIKERFGQSGTMEQLYKAYGLNPEKIMQTVHKAVKNKKKAKKHIKR